MGLSIHVFIALSTIVNKHWKGKTLEKSFIKEEGCNVFRRRPNSAPLAIGRRKSQFAAPD